LTGCEPYSEARKSEIYVLQSEVYEMRTKIRKGWYVSNGYHIVETERYGGDKCLDWVVVESPDIAYRLFHGAEITTYFSVHNRLKDAVAWAESEPRKAIFTEEETARIKRLASVRKLSCAGLNR
jgi:hypothetical protein